MLVHNSEEYTKMLKNVQLKKVGFLEIHSILHLENYGFGEMNVDIKNEVQIPETDKPERRAILDKYKITGIIENKSVFDIDATLILLIESKESFTSEFLTIFSKTNGKLITYPYLRQAVQDLTSKMGIPSLSLPLWQNPSTLKEEKKETTAVTP
jgi:preprotein translocase subunit SecB